MGHGYGGKWTLLKDPARFGKMKSTAINQSDDMCRWAANSPKEYPCLARTREVYAGGCFDIEVTYVYMTDAKKLLT